MKRFRQYLLYLFVRWHAFILGLLPRRCHRAFAWFWAKILYPVPQLGKVAFQNVRAVYPDRSVKECKKIAFESILHLVQVALEFFWLRRRKKHFPVELIHTDEASKQCFLALHDEGRPVIFITPHHGNWELAGQMVAMQYGFPLATIMRPPKNPYLSQFLQDGRAVDGVRLIFAKGAARAVKNALKEGTSIGMLSDQNTRVRDGGVFAEFFGFPVPTSSLPARMAIMENVSVLIGSVCRNPDRTFTMRATVIHAGEEQDEMKLTSRILNEIEKLVRLCPEQYLWMYKRFQYIPAEAEETLRQKYPPYATVAGPTFYDQRARRDRNKARMQN